MKQYTRFDSTLTICGLYHLNNNNFGRKPKRRFYDLLSNDSEASQATPNHVNHNSPSCKP